jgi:hypothetical protein
LPKLKKDLSACEKLKKFSTLGRIKNIFSEYLIGGRSSLHDDFCFGLQRQWWPLKKPPKRLDKMSQGSPTKCPISE